jgi:hypothetical protein
VTARRLSSCGTSIEVTVAGGWSWTGATVTDGGQPMQMPAGSHHIAFSFVPRGMNWALLGLPAGVAIMLVPTARSAFSFRVRR